MTSERCARLGLAAVVEPGGWGLHQALARVGAVEVWELLRRGEPVRELSASLAAAAHERARGYDPVHELTRLVGRDIRLVIPGDEEWPESRLTWPSGAAYAPPTVLFVRGSARLDQVIPRSVSVVGARAATAYGEHVCRELCFGISERGWTVVSGAAYGIDRAAHLGALDGGSPTVAVLACGVDVPYPRGNESLLTRIARAGAIVSEWPPGSSPTRVRFLVRNRVIAALSAGTVVVEAALRSGSLSTLARARELDRPVMAVPGPVTSAQSAGCHQQLRQPVPAVCVTRAEEVLDTVGLLSDDAAPPLTGLARDRDALSATVRQVLDAVPVREALGEASIACQAGVPVLVAQQVLPPLLVAGLVERIGGGWRLSALGAGRPLPRSR